MDQGVDTFEGRFTSADGSVVIRHDIGFYAGSFASRKDALEFLERDVAGKRIWTAKRRRSDARGGYKVMAAVTFPDSGDANFFVEDASPAATAAIENIAATFRPKL